MRLCLASLLLLRRPSSLLSSGHGFRNNFARCLSSDSGTGFFYGAAALPAKNRCWQRMRASVLLPGYHAGEFWPHTGHCRVMQQQPNTAITHKCTIDATVPPRAVAALLRASTPLVVRTSIE